MTTITENIARIQQAKEDIKEAIIAKGVAVEDDAKIDEYAEKIEEIQQGVSDYTLLSNKPSINDIVLNGNKTAEDLGLQPKGEYPSVEDVNEALNALAEQIPTDYLTEEDLEGYAKTSDIPSVAGLASETYVTQQIAATLGSINAQLEEV